MNHKPAIGIAYSGYVSDLIRVQPESFDYVELPFECIRADASAIQQCGDKPIVLHCASLSIAGTVPPTDGLLQEVSACVSKTKTPWLGEHLSFITANREEAGSYADEYAPGEPFNIGYTVSAPFNDESIERVLASLKSCSGRLGVPLLLENPPVYFPVPGSTMSQTEMVCEICERSDVGLLLDLAHFLITAHTLRFDPFEEVVRYPLDRVREVHVSGLDFQDGGYWDDHAARAPERELQLLKLVLSRSPVQAVTLEYNWSAQFPRSLLTEEIERVRTAVGRAS
jgi:uncharacterized protein